MTAENYCIMTLAVNCTEFRQRVGLPGGQMCRHTQSVEWRSVEVKCIYSGVVNVGFSVCRPYSSLLESIFCN